MRYVIAESRLNHFILEYIEDNFSPDAWIPFPYARAAKGKMIEYFVNDKQTFSYFQGFHFGSPDIPRRILRIDRPSVVDSLNSLFPGLWAPVFKEWYESNTGSPVHVIVSPHNKVIDRFF